MMAGVRVARDAIRYGIASAADFVEHIASKEKRPLTDEQTQQLRQFWAQAEVENRQDIINGMRREIAENNGSINNLAARLARFGIEEGVTRGAEEGGVKARDLLVDYVHQKLLEVDNTITRRQVERAISGYGQYRLLSKDEVSMELRDIRGQLQQIGKLQDMAEGLAPSKTGQERRNQSLEERELIKQVNEAKKRGGYEVTDPDTQLKTAEDAIRTRMRNEIESLEKQIETGVKTIKERRTVKYTEDMLALRAKLEKTRQEYHEVFDDPELTRQQRLQKLKDNAMERIGELERRLREGDFAKKERAAQIEPDEQLMRLRLKEKKLKDQVNSKMRELEESKRSTMSKAFRNVVEVTNNAPKTLMASIDAPLGRQALFTLVTRPTVALRSIPEAWRAFFSKNVADKAEVKLENRPNYVNGVYQKMRIDFTKTHGEEGFMSKLFAKVNEVPGVGKMLGKVNFPEASERAFRTMLNRIRADLADLYVGELTGPNKSPTVDELRVIGNFINVSTGRLSPSRLKQATSAMNTVLFAPQYAISRAMLATGAPMFHGTAFGDRLSAPRARKIIAKEYAKAGLAVATTAGLLKTAFELLGDKEYDVGLDPRSPDFLQVRMGNTRIDISGGLKAWYVLGARMFAGTTLTQQGTVKEADFRDLAGQFAWQKASPLLSTVAELVTGKDALGRAISPAEIAVTKVTPVYARDVVESARDLGLPAALVPWMLGMQGFGINTYDNDDRRLSSLYQMANRRRPVRSKGQTLESYQEQVKKWETERQGAQDLLNRSRVEPGEIRRRVTNYQQQNKLKRLGITNP